MNRHLISFLIYVTLLNLDHFSQAFGKKEDDILRLKNVHVPSEHAQRQQQDQNQYLNRYKRIGNIRMDTKTEIPVAIYDSNYKVSGSNANEKALDFIRNNKELLHLDKLLKQKDDSRMNDDEKIDSNSQYDDPVFYLEHSFTSTISNIWTTVRYQQTYRGIPVYGSDVAITINSKDEVKMVMPNFRYGLNILDNSASSRSTKLTAEKVIQMTMQQYNAENENINRKEENQINIYKQPLLVFYHQDQSNSTVLAWQIEFQNRIQHREMQILYHDETGDILLELDLSHMSTTKRKLPQMNKDNLTDKYHRNHENTKNLADKKTFLRRSEELPYQKASQSLSIFELFIYFIQTILQILIPPSPSAPSTTTPLTITPSMSPTLHPPTINYNNHGILVRGNIFDPEPISSSQNSYGWSSGFVDNSDENSDKLSTQMYTVALRDVEYKDGLFTLRGPYASIVDEENPRTGIFQQESPDFLFTRDQPGFEAVNCYYHIDNFMRYLNNNLELDIRPKAYDGGIRFDPHGYEGEDNSRYWTHSGVLVYGEGGVDDGEDAEVIIHELAHGIHHWMTGYVNNNQGLAEGFGDYLALSYSRGRSRWTQQDEEYYWVFKWDGHNEFWNGRFVNDAPAYPSGLTGELFEDAKIWSVCTLKIWDAIGRKKSDIVHILGLSTTNQFSTQEDTAIAMLLAAKDSEYPLEDITQIESILKSCGYQVDTVN